MTLATSLTCDECRRFDAAALAAGIPGPVLMENAARGAVELLLSLGVCGPVAVVCGKGNNAGDGFVIARLLHAAGVDVAVELVVPSNALSGDAAIAFAPLAGLRIPIHTADEELASRLSRREWIVDALLGTGITGQVRAPFDRAIECINAAHRRVFAVDLSSGLDGDSGLPQPIAVRADHTVTFVARKRGFDNPASAQFTGKVHVVNLGVSDAGFTS